MSDLLLAGLPADPFALLEHCLSADRAALRRRLRGLKSRPAALADLPQGLGADLLQSLTRRAERAARLPRPEFPPELPVNQRRQEIAEAIRAHQVVIVCGETGSGKTTQLPKICLELGRGVAGLIGHTQPRRLAARATASRIAQELKSELGQAVGYKIRFTDRIGPQSYVKLMTDGILLAETQGDPQLAAYDMLIIDEAHERSLNIDFLLGYLRQLLPKRPDLKVIVTSATLDAERFAKHFADRAGKPAPVIEVSGRLYPIEMRYRPVEPEGTAVPHPQPPLRAPRAGLHTGPASAAGSGLPETPPTPRGARGASSGLAAVRKAGDLYEALVDAVDEAHRAGPGDVLVFLPGEREIREAAEALRKAHHAAQSEVLPLFARQSAQEQARVFAPSKGRRVILATNVAETSLTVPGIRYVVDTGLARVKRYSARNKVEQLQVEPVAQAAARQRAGRCGRVMDGICFRLYAEDDFNERPAHTDPEILRSSLAGVILRMKALNLGEVEDFPFIDPPLPKMVADGYQLLTELGALEEAREPSPSGASRDSGVHRTPPAQPAGGAMPAVGRGAGQGEGRRVEQAPSSAQDAQSLTPGPGSLAGAPSLRGRGAVLRETPSAPPEGRGEQTAASRPFLKLALSATGRELAKLPLDPKVGRMILAARERGCLREMLVIAAALSVQDPRERPPENPGAADQAHAKFRGGEQDQRSEFLWFLHAWKAYEEVVRHESGNQQKQWCKRHFLSYLRMREWRDVHSQLHTLCAEHGWKESEQAANYEAIHKALLAGLLGHVGCKIEDASGPQAGSYLGARGIKFWPHPGSALARKAGKWIVSAELVETTRLFGRCLARIEPEWLEEVGAHLVRRQVYEPHWEKGVGAVRAWERGTLHGLTLYARRPVAYRDVDPALCRELFIREGLVQGEIAEGPARAMAFLAHNRRLVAEIERLEHKARRPDVLVDEALIEAFYDAKIPAEVADLASFEAWRKGAEKTEPKLLHLTRDQLMRHEAEGVTTDRFPASFQVLGQKLKLAYLHAPGEADDGVTLTVPLAMLNQIPAARCEWLVPGLLEEKVTALLKTVPQKHRQRLQPISQSAGDFMALFDAGELDCNEPLVRALQRFVEERVSLKLPMESFRLENLNPHCFMNFRVQDEHGRVLAQSRNLAELRARFHGQIAAAFQAAGVKVVSEEAASNIDVIPAKAGIQVSAQEVDSRVRGDDGKESGGSAQQTGLTAWTFGELPELLEVKIGNREVIGFPALHDDGDAVSIRPYDTPEEAARIHRKGLARLFALALKDQARAIERLPGIRELALQFIPFGTEAELKAQLVTATLERTCLLDPLPAKAEAFEQRAREAKPRITLVAQELMRLAGQLLAEHATLTKRLAGLKTFPEVAADIQAQAARLMPKDFLVAQPWERLAHFPRYLKAATVRIDKLRANPARDAQLMAEWKSLAQPWEREHLAKLKAGVVEPALEDFRWLLEELRVGLYAQELKTPMPVSVKRLQKIWEARPR